MAATPTQAGLETSLTRLNDCLQVRLSSRDPRRARAVGMLRSQRLGAVALTPWASPIA